jgi:hypothetical protein
MKAPVELGLKRQWTGRIETKRLCGALAVRSPLD